MKLKLKVGKVVTPTDIEQLEPVFEDIGRIVSTNEGYLLSSVIIVAKGKRYRLSNASEAQTRLSDAGVKDGATLMVLGHAAAEVQQALSDSKDDPTLLGIEAELMRSAQRSNKTAPTKVPTGPYTFLKYHALSTNELPGAFPSPSRALQLLHRLAADPGIVHIMKENEFSVGLLSEMPPTDFMDDTRAVTCLLGLNINKGQEIKLRLRTNDLKGFRKYAKIRETLVHELTHNVWGDHDNNFKTLNSRLLRDCIRMSHARILGGQPSRSQDLDAVTSDVLAPEEDGPTHHAVGGHLTDLPPTAAAAAAAERRFAASRPAESQTPVHEGEGVDVTTAFEHADDTATEREEQILSAWGAASAAEGAQEPPANDSDT